MRRFFAKGFFISLIFLLFGSCGNNELQRKLDELQKEIDEDFDQQYPKKSYEKEAHWFFNQMKNRYSFWGNNKKDGDKDSFDNFKNYYLEHKKKLEEPMRFFSGLKGEEKGAQKIFQDWINPLTDGHLSLTFFDLGFIDKYGLGPEEKRKDTSYIDYSTYDEELKKVNPDFEVLAKRSYKEDGVQRHLLCGTFPSKNKKKILYLGFSGFLPTKVSNPINNFIFDDFTDYFQDDKNLPETIVINLNDNSGGNALTEYFLSFLFTNNIDNTFGCKKERISTDPKAPKTPWEKVSLKFSSDYLKDHLFYLFDKSKKKNYSEIIAAISKIPTIILISGNTASAAEYFAACLRQRPSGKVMLVGKQTRGMFSSVTSDIEANRKLYEGGTFKHLNEEGKLSMELKIGTKVYKFAEGEIEGQGIKPHVEVSGAKAQIEKAIELINDGTVEKQLPTPISCN